MVVLDLPTPTDFWLTSRVARSSEGIEVDRIVRQQKKLLARHYKVPTAVELLSNQEILSLCDSQMMDADQEELSALLAEQGAGKLTPARRCRLDDLMKVYREGLLRKSEALRVAVQRGLKPPLG